MSNFLKEKPSEPWPQKQSALPTFLSGSMDLDESQDDPARKSLDDLARTFDRKDDSGKRGASASAGKDSSPVKEKLAKIRKMQEENGAASASSDAKETNNALLEAIGLISQKMDQLCVTTATKADVDIMTAEMKQQTKLMIAEAVDPLKAEVYDLKQQMEELKDRNATGAPDGGTASTMKPTQDLEEMRSIINTMDPATKTGVSHRLLC